MMAIIFQITYVLAYYSSSYGFNTANRPAGQTWTRGGCNACALKNKNTRTIPVVPRTQRQWPNNGRSADLAGTRDQTNGNTYPYHNTYGNYRRFHGESSGKDINNNNHTRYLYSSGQVDQNEQVADVTEIPKDYKENLPFFNELYVVFFSGLRDILYLYESKILDLAGKYYNRTRTENKTFVNIYTTYKLEEISGAAKLAIFKKLGLIEQPDDATLEQENQDPLNVEEIASFLQTFNAQFVQRIENLAKDNPDLAEVSENIAELKALLMEEEADVVNISKIFNQAYSNFTKILEDRNDEVEEVVLDEDQASIGILCLIPLYYDN